MSIDLYDEAIQKLCKWRSVLTGWQLGTRPKGDPEGDAVRDQRELLLLLRCEVTAITGLLMKLGVTEDEIRRAVAEEAEHLSAAMEKKFPGFTATPYGISIDPAIAFKTMEGWKP